MDSLRQFLLPHWFGVLLLIAGLVQGLLLLLGWQRRKVWSLPLFLVGSGCALAGLGGLLLPWDTALWVAGLALFALFVMLLVVIVTGNWSAPAGYAVGALTLFGLGGVCITGIS